MDSNGCGLQVCRSQAAMDFKLYGKLYVEYTVCRFQTWRNQARNQADFVGSLTYFSNFKACNFLEPGRNQARNQVKFKEALDGMLTLASHPVFFFIILNKREGGANCAPSCCTHSTHLVLYGGARFSIIRAAPLEMQCTCCDVLPMAAPWTAGVHICPPQNY